jgi:hypothetical protein
VLSSVVNGANDAFQKWPINRAPLTDAAEWTTVGMKALTAEVGTI